MPKKDGSGRQQRKREQQRRNAREVKAAYAARTQRISRVRAADNG